MTRDNQGWIASRYSRLSTGIKMLLILSLALFPLGLIASLASIESARRNAAERADETINRLKIKAQRIDSALSRSAISIGASSAALALTPRGSGVCATTLRRLAAAPAAARYALFGTDGQLRCVSPGFAPASPPRQRGDETLSAELAERGESLRFAVYGENNVLEGMGEYSRATLIGLADIPGTSPDLDLDLRQGSRRMILRDGYTPGPLVRTARGTEPIAGGRLQLDIAVGATPVTASEILLTLLPVLMWLSAGLIGWLIADRLLSRPLLRMQRAVSAYRPGDRHLDLPNLSTPAREIGELGQAFDKVTQTVARHEAELEAAIERQTRLVREVHHRVKNNLQVVASLLNLHSRGAANEEVAAAYASIQRRVDALAVVHRNHFAELEDNKGVALKSLISELGANLRATAPASASNMAITLNLEPLYVTQDVAVSVAFLVTEMVEFAMFCEATPVAISLQRGEGLTARLTVDSDSLKGDTACDEKLFERFDRIITGLSRQLRSTMERDLVRGCYSVDLAIAPDLDE